MPPNRFFLVYLVLHACTTTDGGATTTSAPENTLLTTAAPENTTTLPTTTTISNLNNTGNINGSNGSRSVPPGLTCEIDDDCIHAICENGKCSTFFARNIMVYFGCGMTLTTLLFTGIFFARARRKTRHAVRDRERAARQRAKRNSFSMTERVGTRIQKILVLSRKWYKGIHSTSAEVVVDSPLRQKREKLSSDLNKIACLMQVLYVEDTEQKLTYNLGRACYEIEMMIPSEIKHAFLDKNVKRAEKELKLLDKTLTTAVAYLPEKYEDLRNINAADIRALRRKVAEYDYFFVTEASEKDDETIVNRLFWYFNFQVFLQVHGPFYIVVLLGYFSQLALMFRFVGASQAEMQGRMYLTVPPQYSLDTRVLHSQVIPVIYGFMHGSLYCLALLPVTFARGFWRDVSRVLPMTRKVIPVDNFITLHKMLGYLCLAGLFIGAMTWLVFMGSQCLTGVDTSCLAFDPILKTFFLNPIENVVMLRVLVWPSFLLAIPMMERANHPPPARAPLFIKTRWYEICYALHLGSAWVVVTLALIARFEVFYPIIPGWALYFVNNIREYMLHTHTVYINISSSGSTLHMRSGTSQPANVNVVMRNHESWKSGPGQWTYLMIPRLDRTWHPFTLSSTHTRKELNPINFKIGVRHGWRGNAATTSQEFEPDIQTQKRQTWTYKLYNAVKLQYQDAMKKTNNANDEIEGADIKAYIKGPYGTSFESSLNPNLDASILIGAGTGLTNAMACLEEAMYRKQRGEDIPGMIWFVWATQSVDDLMWVWKTLVSTLESALQNDALVPPIYWGPSSRLLDWLGVTIYISRPSADEFKSFVDQVRPVSKEKEQEGMLLKISEQDTKIAMGMTKKMSMTGGDMGKGHRSSGWALDGEVMQARVSALESANPVSRNRFSQMQTHQRGIQMTTKSSLEKRQDSKQSALQSFEHLAGTSARELDERTSNDQEGTMKDQEVHTATMQSLTNDDNDMGHYSSTSVLSDHDRLLLFEWMTHNRRLCRFSMDDENHHIKHLFKFIIASTTDLHDVKKVPVIAARFSGPPVIARLITRATAGTGIEFISEAL